MAYHEQHERNCPFCGVRISATAPKCLNCGEYVDDADNGEEDEDNAAATEKPPLLGVMVGIGIALACAALFAYICFWQT